MASALSGFGPLTGPGSTRRLGTEAGAIRREARKIRRAGGDDRRLLEAASMSGLRDGSISSADSNMEEDAFGRRAAAGLGAARQGVLREMAGQGGADPMKTTVPAVVSGVTSNPPAEGMSVGTPAPSPMGAGTGALRDAGAERRMADRSGVLRSVMDQSKSSGMTRRGALESANAERVAAGKAPMDISNEEFFAESTRQKDLVKSNRSKSDLIEGAYSAMDFNKSALFPMPVTGLTVDLNAARAKGAKAGRKSLRNI